MYGFCKYFEMEIFETRVSDASGVSHILREGDLVAIFHLVSYEIQYFFAWLWLMVADNQTI